ncbi:MAG: PTS sugar transporter subunit IIA [Treponema sp.]|jgi:PTS system nitrogen regulatory IIA component|nr:PTS sugar transporter subunit IIA [Treponema sp.]
MNDTMIDTDQDIPLSTLVERGGIYYELAGNSVETVIAELVRLIPLEGLENYPCGALAGKPEGDFREALLKAALEREALMSTGIGRGVALPHPRNPMIQDTDKQFVAIGFPSAPVDWKALDGKPVHTVLLVVSASPKIHLHTLSKINFLCQDDLFLSLLRARASQGFIAGAIREAERTWQ